MYFLTAFLRNRLCPHIDNDPTDACKDNKKKKSRLSIITVFISYVKNSLANKVIWHCVEYFFLYSL